ncbi:MAG: hypothetical protein DI582_10855 [Azospirillum brasilense]|nr:MAG: hypothetical protein DI582_10855 [Azospirillum brasilense]
MPRRPSGFSLVELSIVLVILGLLTGGILGGQSLIRAAQLRKVTNDAASIATAMGTFRDKYFYLPGDLPNATSFWGAADGGDGAGTDCYMANNNNATTCNGDGDGRVGKLDASLPSGPESYRFWQHLNNAGIYNAPYTGVPATGGYSFYWDDSIGVNIPRAPISDRAGYSVSQWASGFLLNGAPRNTTLYVASCCLGGSGQRRNIEGPIAKPEEVWNIDTKIDDGKPQRGNVQIYNGYGSCIIDADNYNLTDTANRCPIVIGLGQ